MGSDLTIDEAYFINDWGEIMALGVFPTATITLSYWFLMAIATP